MVMALQKISKIISKSSIAFCFLKRNLSEEIIKKRNDKNKKGIRTKNENKIQTQQ